MIVNIPPFDTDDIATAAAFNERFAVIAQALNKGLDADNIKNNSLVGALFAADMLNRQYPVGSLYFNATVDTNPNTLLGFGVWSAFGAGRMPVFFDGTQTEFNAVGKLGGHKELQAHSHTGSTSADGNHSHNFSGSNSDIVSGQRSVEWSDSVDVNAGVTTTNGNHSHSFTTNSTGGGNAGNLPPFITIYAWVRTS